MFKPRWPPFKDSPISTLAMHRSHQQKTAMARIPSSAVEAGPMALPSMPLDVRPSVPPPRPTTSRAPRRLAPSHDCACSLTPSSRTKTTSLKDNTVPCTPTHCRLNEPRTKGRSATVTFGTLPIPLFSPTHPTVAASVERSHGGSHRL